MKTPLQELIEILNKRIVDSAHNKLVTKYGGDYRIALHFAIVEAENLLEKEKQEIKDAYWAGLNGCINDYSESKQVGNEMIGIKYNGGAEFYYTKIYANTENDSSLHTVSPVE